MTNGAANGAAPGTHKPDDDRFVIKGKDKSRSGRRLTAQEAAEELGITVEAVRSRIKRGTLTKEKGPDGTVYVRLDNDRTRRQDDRTGNRFQDRMCQGDDRFGVPSGSGEDRFGNRTLDRSCPDREGALEEALRDQVEILRGELEDRKEESRRKDTIIAQLAQRIPELPSAAAPGSRDAAETASEDRSGGDDALLEPREPSRRRSWLHRFFGFG